MDENLKEEILRNCIRKREGKIDQTWQQLACQYKDYFENGESIRCWTKNELKKRNELPSINHDEDYIKVLIINDLHIPYQRNDVLDQIKKYKNIDYLIIGGDLLDCESCSFWKSFKHPDVNAELILAHEFISKVNKIIDKNKTKIIAIRGNHEYRFTRLIMEMQEKQLQKMLNPNLLSMLEKGFTFYEDDKDVTYKPIENFKYINNWYTKLFNNLIIAHPTDFSAVDGKMSEKVAEYFLNQGIANKDDIIIFGHTHKFSNLKINRRQSMFVIENGCLCKEQPYANTGRLKFTLQNYNYTYLRFKKGKKIDLNDIKINFLK